MSDPTPPAAPSPSPSPKPEAPPIMSFREMVDRAPEPPPQLVHGLLHQGCKMILGGTSKSNKSWCLMDLAMSVATGQMWWHHPCEQARVVYINFELHDWAVAKRMADLRTARPEAAHLDDTLFFWNLRGHNMDITLMRPHLEKGLREHEFGLIIFDPMYKMLGSRDENSNGEVADLMNVVEGIAQTTKAALVMSHHYAKGNASGKEAIDRTSGAGAWSRDPDTLLNLTPHGEPYAFVVSPTLRNFAPMPEYVVTWDFPVMRMASDLNPEDMRGVKKKNMPADGSFLAAVFGAGVAMNEEQVHAQVDDLWQMSGKTMGRYLARLVKQGHLRHAGGRYEVTAKEKGAL